MLELVFDYSWLVRRENVTLLCDAAMELGKTDDGSFSEYETE
jgi:hypothetical protein